MRYIRSAVGATTLVPKLLGTYEEELHPVWERMVDVQPEVVLDIGSAEGYYAVGLSRRLPDAHILAYDVDPVARTLCRDLAAANEVSSRIEVLGRASGDEIDRRIGNRRALVIADCEGCEAELLDPVAARSLRGAYIVVELHEHLVPGVQSLITSRFEATHRVAILEAVGRDTAVHRHRLPMLRPSEIAIALSEFRPAGMRWAALDPKTA